jgi:DNA-binding NarL/FixJ family response regulator
LDRLTEKLTKFKPGESTLTTQRQTILLADADEFFRTALKCILQQTHSASQIVDTETFDEAVSAIGEGHVDLILIGSTLLEGDGYAQIRAMRECFPTTSILVVGASRRRRDVIVALEAGANGVVMKDGGIAPLVAALRCVAEGGIYVPPFVAQAESFCSGDGSELRSILREPVVGLLEELSPRQREVLELVVSGKSNKEIARALKLGEGTVKVHMSALFRALDVHTRSAAAAIGSKLFGDRLRAA